LGRHAYPTPGALQQRVEELNAEAVAASRPPNFRLKTIPQGAATTVWAGVVAAADAVGGRYCEDCGVAEVITVADASLISAGVRAYALDPERAKALWRKSEEMVGEVF
jgi:hypothetical protein